MLRTARFFHALGPSTVLLVAATACTTSNPNSPDGGSPDASADSAPATCPAPGAPTPGPADAHCGTTVQSTSTASCHPDAAAAGDAGPPDCAYGPTMFGHETDDDDCKYHVKWSSGDICEGTGYVPFTVVVTNKSDGTPLTGAATVAEVFTTTPGDASCDTQSTHPGPNSGVVLAEGPPGTYTGRIGFNAPGQWTVRFHFHQECADLLPDSPHGHAAYHLTVP